MTHLPWTEVYQPTSLDDLQQDYATRMKTLVDKGCELSYLLVGPPGIGKTTTALCLAHHCFPDPVEFEKAVRVVNASDERNPADVYKAFGDFCRHYISKKSTHKRIFILDEADNMTKRAQEVLATLMDEFKHSTTVILTGNHPERMEPLLKSRCLVLYCKFPSVDQQKAYLKNICEKEELSYNDTALQKIVEFARQDLRQATNLLQSVARTNAKQITVEGVSAACDDTASDLIEDWITECYRRGHKPRCGLDALQEILDRGFMASDIWASLVFILLHSMPARMKPKVGVAFITHLTNVALEMGAFDMTENQLKAVSLELSRLGATVK